MNKKTIKIAGWALGLSMAVAGIGVAVGRTTASIETKADAKDTGGTATYTVSTKTSVSVSGDWPTNSSATYSQTYGTLSQATKNNSFTLTLSGYDGKRITGLSVRVHSNGSSGAGNLSFTTNGNNIGSISTANFNTSSWNGSWSSSYVNKNVTCTPTTVGASKTVVLTIAATANSLYFESASVTWATPSTPVSSISLDSENYLPVDGIVSIAKGTGDGSVLDTLTPAVLPGDATDKSVNWSTTDENVAAVDENGNVLIDTSSVGEATVTATANDGSGVNASITYSIYDPAATYSVTYNANGCDGGTVPTDTNEYAKDSEVTVLGNTGSLTKEGYVFAGWNTAAAGNGTNYSAGDTFDITANTTLYAKWVEEDSIVVKSASVDIKVGQAYDLTENLTLTGVGALTFSVADDTYATLDGNILTGKAKGDVIVTARKGSLDPVNFTVQVDNADLGTQYNPYTVSEALNASVGDDVYVVGYISTITDINTNYGNATFSISDDGTTENEMCAFRGLYLNGAAITNDNKGNYVLGSKVVLHGQIAEHNSEKELGQGNVLISIEKAVATTVNVSLVDVNRKFYTGNTNQSKIKASDFNVGAFNQFEKSLDSFSYSISVRKNGVQQGNSLTGNAGVELFENAEPSSPSVIWTAVAIVDNVESEPIEITVLAKAPETLAVTYSGKTEFYERIDAPVQLADENIDLSVTYNDGSNTAQYGTINPKCDISYAIGETPVDINDYILDGHFNVAEDTTFTVTYSIKTDPSVKGSFNFTVYNFTSLTATDATTRTYYAKETYSLSYVVTAHYGTRTKVLTADQYEADITEMTPSSEGKVTATIDAGILGTTTVDFTINPEITLVSTSVTAPTKENYKFGEAFDATGLSVSAEYSDSNVNDVTDQVVLSEYDPYKLGTQTITVSLKGDVIDSFDVTNTFVGASMTNPAIDAQGSGFSSSAEVTGWSWSGEGSDYAAGNAPYLLKMDNTGDTITYKLPNNAFTKAASISAELYVKKIGGANNSSFTVSALDVDGNAISTNQIAHTDTNVANGKQNDTHTLSATLNNPNGIAVYGVRFTFNKGSNIGVSGGRVQAAATKNEALIAQQAPAMLDYLSQFKTCPSGWADRSDIEKLVAEYNAMHDDAKDAFELLTLTDYDWENLDEYDASNHSYTGGDASRDGIKAIDKLKEMVSQYNNSLEQGESQLVLETPSGNFAVLPKNPNVGTFADVGDTGMVLVASTVVASLIAAGFILLRKRKEDR